MTQWTARLWTELDGLAGTAVAGICLRAAASAAGKTTDSLDEADAAVIGPVIRGLLAPVAPAESVERLLERTVGRA
jgi:hypothetical protein